MFTIELLSESVKQPNAGYVDPRFLITSKASVGDYNFANFSTIDMELITYAARIFARSSLGLDEVIYLEPLLKAEEIGENKRATELFESISINECNHEILDSILRLSAYVFYDRFPDWGIISVDELSFTEADYECLLQCANNILAFFTDEIDESKILIANEPCDYGTTRELPVAIYDIVESDTLWLYRTFTGEITNKDTLALLINYSIALHSSFAVALNVVEKLGLFDPLTGNKHILELSVLPDGYMRGIDKAIVKNDVKKFEKDPWVVYYSNVEFLINDEKIGKWLLFYDNPDSINTKCFEAVDQGVCPQVKYRNSANGVACFYCNADDFRAHYRIIHFLIENNLISKNKNGNLHNISFKLDEQTDNDEYGKNFKAKLTLDMFVNLETGNFKKLKKPPKI